MTQRGQTLVRGHSLRGEGAPYDEYGQRVDIGGRYYYGASGEGRAMCSCGELSSVLPSATQRRAWHRGHKAEHR